MKDYLISLRKQFQNYKNLAEKTFDQVPEEKLSWQYNEQSNSIATIVKHLSGNMISRWTDFMITDGEKEWRQRDAEFENDISSKEQMMEVWEKGWKCLFEALDSIQLNDLGKIVYIRQEGHTVLEAINRQFAHYSYHIGQIVLLGKMIVGEDWDSLSIPKGKSESFNRKKFTETRKLTEE